MTPQERQLVAELFDRLATLEGNRRDPEAEALIADGAPQRAPHALYALVQTVLVQDEALRSADARIRELEGGDAAAPGRAVFSTTCATHFSAGARKPRLGAVGRRRAAMHAPRQSRAPDSARRRAVSGGGSFLGTAAASAAGVIGGALLLNSFRSMFGGGGQQHGMLDRRVGQNTPWGGGNAANSDLAREAGVE